MVMMCRVWFKKYMNIFLFLKMPQTLFTLELFSIFWHFANERLLCHFWLLITEIDFLGELHIARHTQRTAWVILENF